MLKQILEFGCREAFKTNQQQFYKIQLRPWCEFLQNKFLWKDCSNRGQPDPDPGNFSEELSHLLLKICSH